jgi:hypothetical protein
MRPPSGRVLGGVVHEVADDLREPRLIARHPDRIGGQLDAQIVVRSVDRGLPELEGGLDHGAQVEAVAAQFDLAGGDSRDVEQVVDQLDEQAALPVHHAEHAIPRRRLGRAVQQDLEPVAERAQRVAQLVREGRQELVLAPVGLAKRLFGGGLADELIADLVLAPARPQRGVDRADERPRRRRQVEQRHVRETRQRPLRERGSLPVAGQQHRRNVGPRRLRCERRQKRPRHPSRQRRVGQDDRADTPRNLARQLVEPRARQAIDPGVREKLARDLGVAPRRRDDEDPLARTVLSRHFRSTPRRARARNLRARPEPRRGRRASASAARSDEARPRRTRSGGSTAHAGRCAS